MFDGQEKLKQLEEAFGELRGFVDEIAKSVDGNGFLSEQLCGQTKNKLDEISRLQTECFGIFSSIGFEVKSVADMSNALIEYTKQRDRERLAKVKDVFSNFNRIYSDKEKPQSEIEKFRDEISLLSDEEMLALSADAVMPYRRLYDYVESGSIQSSDQPILYEKFGAEIMFAATMRWLRIADCMRTEPEEIAENSTTAEKEPVCSKVEETTAEVTESVCSDTRGTSAKAVRAEGNVDKNAEAAGEEVLRERGIRICDTQPQLISEVSGKAPSGVKALMSDLMDKRIGAQVSDIVKDVNSTGLIPENTAEERKRAWNYLLSKGLIQKVYPEGRAEEGMYCLSQRGYELLSQKSFSERVYGKSGHKFTNIVTEYIDWIQLSSCSVFIKTCKETAETVACTSCEVTNVYSDEWHIWATVFVLSNKYGSKRVKFIYFPNIAAAGNAENMDKFLANIKEEYKLGSITAFILSDSTDKANAYYTKFFAESAIKVFYCSDDVQYLSQLAADKIHMVFDDALADDDKPTDGNEEEAADEDVDFDKIVVDATDVFDGAAEDAQFECVEEEAEDGVQEDTVAEELDVANDNQAEEDNAIEEAQTSADETEDGSATSTDESVTENNTVNWEEQENAPSDAQFGQLISEILNTGVNNETELNSVMVRAVLLAYSAGMEADRPHTKVLSEQLRLATGLLVDDGAYTADNFLSVFRSSEYTDVALEFSAYMLAMLKSTMSFDLKHQVENLFKNYDEYFEELPAFKSLFNTVLRSKKWHSGGLTPAIVALLGDDDKKVLFEKRLRNEAEANLSVTPPSIRFKEVRQLFTKCFGKGSEFYDCLKVIADGKGDTDIVKAGFSEFTVEDSYDVDDEKINAYINKKWDEFNKKELKYRARNIAINQCKNRLNIIKRWLEHNDNISNLNGLEDLRKLKGEILKNIGALLADRHGWKGIKNSNVLLWMLTYIRNYLEDNVNYFKIYSDVIASGLISCNDDGIPVIDEDMAGIKQFEPWRNVLKFMEAPVRDVAQVEDEILGNVATGQDGVSLKDNLHQLKLIRQAFDVADRDEVVSEEQIKEAVASADLEEKNFRDELELAYTYNRINENEKENIGEIIKKFRESFYATEDFAIWRAFLRALRRQIGLFSAVKQKELEDQLATRLKKSAQSSLLIKAKTLVEERHNFAVAEDLINRFDAGENDFDIDLESVVDKDYFADFLNNAYNPLYQECSRSTNKGKVLSKFGWNYLKDGLPKEWTNRSRAESRKLVESWPAGKGTVKTEQIKTLFTLLGLRVTDVKTIPFAKGNAEIYQMYVIPAPKNCPDYAHPIKAFGTQISSPLKVVVLFGNYMPNDLVNTISSLNLGGMSVVLMDYYLTTADRRLIGEALRKKSGLNQFIIIDQLLLLYLAKLESTERLPALLGCTLPYSIYQPFIMDGGRTADEMFFGRERELRTIMDPGGACVVYGGRQLGKTALLERAESLCSKPDENKFAVYVSIVAMSDEGEVAATIAGNIEEKTERKIVLGSCADIKELCKKLGDCFRMGKISSMHLLMDEVDVFLGSIAEKKYMAIQPLNDLRRETGNKFKFVIAGTHNVCRAKNATEENGIFGQLGTPLCIKPLSPIDALRLLARPLGYLGFQIDKAHLETILANTNYYPGILQFFGYKLVETLTRDYAKYYSASKGNPPFTLKDEQLGSVMNSSELNDSIKEKFRLSLKLDPRYYMIARCLTMLYHYYESDRARDSWLGFKVDTIRDIVSDYDINCLRDESETSFIILLDEMVDMGILSQPAKGVYRLRRNSFVDIIGEDMDELEKEIIEQNKGE